MIKENKWNEFEERYKNNLFILYIYFLFSLHVSSLFSFLQIFQESNIVKKTRNLTPIFGF